MPSDVTLMGGQMSLITKLQDIRLIRQHASLGYCAPAPEVFVPDFVAWPTAQPRPAPPAALPLPDDPVLN